MNSEQIALSAAMRHTVDATLCERAAEPHRAVSAHGSTAARQHQEDPLRRFTPTPYAAALPIMGRTVRLETNSSRILEHMVELFAPYPGSPNECPDFLWRIVVQSDVQMSPPWPKRSVFSAPGLRYAEFGQRNFLAVDIEAREGVAFISDRLTQDALGFTSPFLDTLFYMTASTLGLVSFSAACISSRTKGLLVMGPADQGKTTASYLAAKSGLRFHADQAVFLEMENGFLRAWGDFFPVAFRPQALQFLPELQPITRRFSYCDFSFYYLDRRKFDSARAQAVIPICCVVLERESASAPSLIPIAKADLSRRLSENIPFRDDDRFETQRISVMGALERLPAYHLAYGSDPAVAAPFLRKLLMNDGMVGNGPPIEVTESLGQDIRKPAGGSEPSATDTVSPAASAAALEIQDVAETLDVSVLMPCLNERATIGTCVTKALQSIEELNLTGEVVVGDNGSTDGSQEIARNLGARVISIEKRGYGAALRGAIAVARGRFIVMGDSDGSYDFTQIGLFVAKLREGHDLVIGNRFHGGVLPRAMPRLHRYLGNPVLTAIGQLFFKSPIGDFHCGLRAFRKDTIAQLNLQTRGMEFASEMIVKATIFGLRLAEIPTTLSPDGRNRTPHLRTWRDGWRHLRLLLLYSPRWLFLYPGLLLFVLGTLATIWLLPGPRTIGRVTFDVDTLLFAAMTILIGFEAINFAAFTEVFAITQGLLPADSRLAKLIGHAKLEIGLAIGMSLLLVGGGMWTAGLSYWSSMHFGNLNPAKTLRIVIPGIVCLTLGFQVILSSFFLSVLGMEQRED